MRGASERPLQSVDLDLPLESLICFVGRSGSGNRTMAVEVLYAESRRRYMLALSPVEREGLGGIGRVDVESISGLPPAIYLDGREIPFRGTVAGFLQVDGLLGQFLHRFGEIGCPHCGGTCRAYTPEEGAARGLAELGGERCLLLAPLELEDENATPGVLRELRQAGFLRVRLGGEIQRLDGAGFQQSVPEKGQVMEVVVDRLRPEEGSRMRLIEGLRNARGIARGLSVLEEVETGRRLIVNQQLTCDQCARTYEDLSPDDLLTAGRDRHPLSRHVSLKGRSLADIQAQSIRQTIEFLDDFTGIEGIPALLRHPLKAAMDMEVGHLPLGRRMGMVSTGEGQRLALANFLSSGLVGVLYIFEGLGAGMGAKDGEIWLAGLRRLVDQGNTVLVLDHDAVLLGGADQVLCFEAGEVGKEKRMPYTKGGEWPVFPGSTWRCHWAKLSASAEIRELGNRNSSIWLGGGCEGREKGGWRWNSTDIGGFSGWWRWRGRPGDLGGSCWIGSDCRNTWPNSTPKCRPPLKEDSPRSGSAWIAREGAVRFAKGKGCCILTCSSWRISPSSARGVKAVGIGTKFWQ
ncbi:MAG: hypothetical protein HOC74_06275 [Gemmatimonadetes bacterium]|nr:hypothetical protein [Gemmatimonadota bacterium]